MKNAADIPVPPSTDLREAGPEVRASSQRLVLIALMSFGIYAIVVKLFSLVSTPSGILPAAILPGLGIGCALVALWPSKLLRIAAAVGVFAAAVYMDLGPGGVKSSAVPTVGTVLGYFHPAARPSGANLGGAVWIALIDGAAPLLAALLYCLLVKADRFRGGLVNILIVLFPVLVCSSIASVVSQMLVQYAMYGREGDGIAWRNWVMLGLAQIAGGVLCVPPVMGVAEVFLRTGVERGRKMAKSRVFELAGLVAVALGSAIGIFVVVPPSGVYFIASMLVPIAILVVTAVRIGWTGVGIVGVAIAAVAAQSQGGESGVWSAIGGSSAEQTLTLQLYVVMAVGMALLLAGSMKDRTEAETIRLLAFLAEEQRQERARFTDQLVCVKGPIEVGQAREELKAAMQPVRKWKSSEKSE